MKLLTQIILALVFTAALCSARAGFAQSAFDGGGANGGSMVIGNDNRTCDSSIMGAIRYNSGASALQICAATQGATTSGLVSHWEFEDGTGSGTAADSVGTNDGTLNNMDVNTDWVTGQIGGALDFDGSNDWVTVTNDASLEFGTTQDFSISFWYYNLDNTGYWDLIDKTGTYGYICNFSFGFDGIECYLQGDLTTATVYSAGVLTLENTWYHVVLTADRNGNAQMYIDGSASGSAVDISGVGNIDSGTSLWFGVHHGRLDDIRIYNRVLTTTEIAELYSCGTAGDCSGGGTWTNWGE